MTRWTTFFAILFVFLCSSGPADASFESQARDLSVTEEGMLLPPTAGMHTNGGGVQPPQQQEPVKILLPRMDAKHITKAADATNPETVHGMLSHKPSNPQTGSPYFGEVPIVGNLFKTKRPSDKTDLTVFVTPKLADPTDNN